MRCANIFLALLAVSTATPLLRLRGGAGEPPKWWGKVPALNLRAGDAAPEASEDVEEAMELMRTRGLANVQRAADLLRTALEREPDNVKLKLELADALNAVMRIKTDSNALVIEGTLDTPENKKVWRTIGAEALPLAIAARKEMPKSVRALAVYADAYMFTCSAKGIVKQAVTGAGKEYKRFAKELCAHPSWDSAVGLVFLGGFYNVAPWPAGNKKKAKEYLREAARLYPTKRNLYYVGVNAYQTAEYDVAADHFGRALDAACGSATEEDFKDFLSERSAQGLELAKHAIDEAGGDAK